MKFLYKVKQKYILLNLLLVQIKLLDKLNESKT